MNVLVIDIGGTHVKVASSEQPVPLKIVSGPKMTAKRMVQDVLEATREWSYDVITIGYPGPVEHDRPLLDPHNLAPGWVDFPYQKVFAKPVRFMNDAAIQALGGYKGGKMLFLGIGTGLGSTLIYDNTLIPLELAHLPYKSGRTYEEVIGLAGLKRRGNKRWRKSVLDVVERLRAAFIVDYVLLGGGNAKLMDKLPQGVLQGANSNAIAGGIAIWHATANNLQGGPVPAIVPGAPVAKPSKPAKDRGGKAGKHSRRKGKDEGKAT